MTQRVLIVDENGVVPGDLRPATNTGSDAIKRSDFYRRFDFPFEDRTYQAFVGEIDWNVYSEVLESLIEAKVHGIIIGGPTGEYYAQTSEERTELAAYAKDVIGTRVQLIIGAGAIRTEDAAQYAKDAKAIKADASLVVNGAFKPALSGQTFATTNPATGEFLADVAACASEDVDVAVSNAKEAFEDGRWRSISPRERKAVLLSLKAINTSWQSSRVSIAATR